MESYLDGGDDIEAIIASVQDQVDGLAMLVGAIDSGLSAAENKAAMQVATRVKGVVPNFFAQLARANSGVAELISGLADRSPAVAAEVGRVVEQAIAPAVPTARRESPYSRNRYVNG